MANAHSFPFLCLPYLALEVVIQQMFAKTQWDFSTLSKKSERIVRASTSRQKICLDFCSFSSMGEFEIRIKHSKSNVLHKIKIHRISIRPTISELKEVITNMSSVFRNLDVTLTIYDGGLYRLMFELVPFIKQMSIPLDIINVSSYDTNDDFCKRVLEAAKDARELRIDCRTRRNIDPHELGTFNLEHLANHFSSWVTRDHLLNNFMNCTVIELQNSKITIYDLNALFRSWVEGSNMRIFLWTPLTGILGVAILPIVLDGIPNVAVKKAKIGSDTIKFENDDCFMIEQVGGVKAIVYRGSHAVSMTTKFSLDCEEEEGIASSVFYDYGRRFW